MPRRRSAELPADRPSLTRRGRGVLVAAGGLLLAARLLGSVELAGLAAAAAGAVAVAAVLVGRAPMTYRAQRWLAPSRVGVGAPASGRLRFTNIGPRPTIGTVVAGDGTGRCVVPALGPGAMAEAAYDLPTGRRGTITVGPLAVSVGDPFGLAERRVALAGPDRLVVHPRIHTVLAPPGSSTREARHGATRPARDPRGDDFFALREYEVGDDLRRVHWRSTARHGDLMLRQDELRFGELATVLLDTRAGAHGGGSFERALEVAASVAAALVKDGRRFRLVTTGGFAVELDGGRAGVPGGQCEQRWTALLEHLAGVTPDSAGADSFALTIQSIRRAPVGPLAAVVAHPTAAELAAVGGLRSRLGLVLIAACGEERAEGIGGAGADGVSTGCVAGALVVPVPDTEILPEVWNRAVLSCGRREVARR
jgi:uncharacterized protein (DUF58 family)